MTRIKYCGSFFSSRTSDVYTVLPTALPLRRHLISLADVEISPPRRRRNAASIPRAHPGGWRPETTFSAVSLRVAQDLAKTVVDEKPFAVHADPGYADGGLKKCRAKSLLACAQRSLGPARFGAV